MKTQVAGSYTEKGLSFFPMQQITLELNRNSPDVKFYKKALDDFFNLFGMFIQIGDFPLEYPGLYELIDYANRKGAKTFALRLSYLDETNAKRLKEKNVTAVLLTLMSTNEKKHNRIYSEISSYKKVIDSIIVAGKYGIDLEISTMFIKDNLKEIPDLIEFSESKNAKIFLAQRPCNLNSMGIPYERIGNEQYKKLIAYCMNENDRLKNKMKVVVAHCPHKILFNKDLKQVNALGGCSAGIISCTISSTGKITPCIPLTEFDEGDITFNSLQEIWENSMLFNKLRHRENIRGNCKKCQDLRFCGGCRADAYFDYGDIFEEDPTCWVKN